MKTETKNRKGGWHMAALKKLPIGIENFEEMRREGFYYVDKTRLIEQLLAQWTKVNLFTRPRRFGKTTLLSTVENFLDPACAGHPEYFEKLLRKLEQD